MAVYKLAAVNVIRTTAAEAANGKSTESTPFSRIIFLRRLLVDYRRLLRWLLQSILESLVGLTP
jgi:hypothetical protein